MHNSLVFRRKTEFRGASYQAQGAGHLSIGVISIPLRLAPETVKRGLYRDRHLRKFSYPFLSPNFGSMKSLKVKCCCFPQLLLATQKQIVKVKPENAWRLSVVVSTETGGIGPGFIKLEGAEWPIPCMNLLLAGTSRIWWG